MSSRQAPLEISPDDFRRLGHRLVDRLAAFLERMPQGAVTGGETPAQVRAALGIRPLPRQGRPADALLDEAASLIFEHSLFNGHPRFWGFITSSAAPIGALGDLLAAAVNPNVGGFMLAPIATEIERQTIAWIAELLGYRTDCGGLLVSGGNMANFVGFWVGRRVKAPFDVREGGLLRGGKQLRVYVSSETHTWIQKAADLSGLGTAAIRWIPADAHGRLDPALLRAAILRDREAGDCPVLVVGTAGSVSTGTIDPLAEIADVCREHDLWFHVDGAYGAPAAALPEAPDDLRALARADSVAIDPHKWLYAPLEAGCVLVRDPALLRDTFSYHPPYYPDATDEDEAPTFFHEFGPQNSRGFRALKVWLGLQQAGRDGYVQMIRDDIALAAALYEAADRHAELEAFTRELSIATFRYCPPDLAERTVPRATSVPGEHAVERYLAGLNKAIAERLQGGGEAFLTHAIVNGRYVLRACIVNFRTSRSDVLALPELVARIGRDEDARRRPEALGQ